MKHWVSFVYTAFSTGALNMCMCTVFSGTLFEDTYSV